MTVLVPIVDRAEVAAAYRRFVAALTEGATVYRKTVGWPGGRDKYEVHWQSTVRLWSLFDPMRTGNRYWCCFGANDPTAAKTLGISCEINFVFEGINRRVAGAFLRDDEGRVYVGHSGKIAGGRKGVGKAAFRDYYDCPVREPVRWPDGKRTEMLVIGMLDSDTLLDSISVFVSEVASFKQAVREGRASARQLLSPMSGADTDAPLGDYFSESLQGLASFEQPTREVERRLLHGPVVHALREMVEGAGLQAKKTNRIDLAAVSAAGEVLALYEVKTALDWGSVYGAIGQLLYYGRTGEYRPRRLVAVIPEGGPADLGLRLEIIGIDVVRYARVAGRVVFRDFDTVLSRASG